MGGWQTRPVRVRGTRAGLIEVRPGQAWRGEARQGFEVGRLAGTQVRALSVRAHGGAWHRKARSGCARRGQARQDREQGMGDQQTQRRESSAPTKK